VIDSTWGVEKPPRNILPEFVKGAKFRTGKSENRISRIFEKKISAVRYLQFPCGFHCTFPEGTTARIIGASGPGFIQPLLFPVSPNYSR